MKDFRELQVWSKAIELFEDAVKDIEGFPKTEVVRIITTQIERFFRLSFWLVQNLSLFSEGFPTSGNDTYWVITFSLKSFA